MVNVVKPKVIIFNGVNKNLDLHLLFRGEEVDITIMYTYLGCVSRVLTLVSDQFLSLRSIKDIDP